MAKITNEAAKLLTFKALDSKPEERFQILPGQTKTVSEADLNSLAKRDAVFLGYYKIRALTIEGWSPDDVEQDKSMAREMRNPHRPAPDFSGHKRDDLMPEEDPNEGKERQPIEPTPMGGVPGNAKQAAKIVKAETDVERLNEYLAVETRDSVKKALVKRIDELEAAALDDDDGE